MRKKFVVGFLLVSFFLLSASSVLAVAGNTMGIEGTGTGGLRGTGGVGSASAARQNLIQQRQEIHAQFLDKLKTIRDARKKQVVQNLETKMNNVNKRRTDEMLNVLNRMQSVLTRLDTMAKNLLDKFGVKVNLTDYNALSKTAEVAITEAITAVQAQAAKTYTPNVVSETALRLTVGQNVSQLTADLKTVREKVIAARKAVLDAYLALVKARSVVIPVTPAASPSATIIK